MFRSVLVVFYRNYMNDALRTDVFVRFEPETIACACIYLAARALQVSAHTPLLLVYKPRPLWFISRRSVQKRLIKLSPGVCVCVCAHSDSSPHQPALVPPVRSIGVGDQGHLHQHAETVLHEEGTILIC